MVSILIDNWSLELFFSFFTYKESYFDESCIGVLTDVLNALVIYDEILYKQDELSEFWTSSARKFLDMSIFRDISNEYDKNKLLEIKHNIFGNEEALGGGIIGRTIDYYLISNTLNVNYQLNPRRERILSDYNLINRGSLVNKLMQNLDANISAYYKDVNAKVGMELYKQEMPSISNYVISRSTSKIELFDNIDCIRKQKETKLFRKELSNLERNSNEGNLAGIRRTFTNIDEIYNEMTKRREIDVTYSFALSPSISFTSKILPSRKYANLALVRKLYKSSFESKQTFNSIKSILEKD